MRVRSAPELPGASPHRSAAPADRYALAEGTVFLSGVQALVRVILDQRRADLAAGRNTATLVSGYQGSPLGGFDQEVRRLGATGEEHHVVLRQGINEELGATAVWGSQLAGTLPGMRYDGVTGVWYGKSPGVDRSADAIRHGNFVGTDPLGGVLALCGDDPACKSSTIPGASEALLAALGVPVLAPGSVQEALDLGRHAIACSRASGLWAALKVVTAVADATGTVEVGPGRVSPILPVLDDGGAPYVHRPGAHLLAPQSLEMERTLTGVRFELAKLYGRENGLNRVTHDSAGARLGIVAAGTAYHQVIQALDELGLGDRVPVRILQVGMLYPFDERTVRDFARGLDELLVVEEKTPFLERLVKDALYGVTAPPLVTGERDDEGRPLVPTAGALDVDAVARAVGRRLLAHDELPEVRARLDAQAAIVARPGVELGAARTPFFCSGCPHNSSLAAPDDEIVGAGIGCHTMVVMAPEGRGRVSGLTQMGGEGAQWVGAAPFLEPRHFTQNLGDGTFHHSGSLAVRAAVAAGLDVTYKLLYNDTVAMTGGQQIQGQMSVAAVAASLAAEGVRRIIVTTEDRSRYDGVTLPAIAELRDRSALLRSQRELAAIEGVTVLIHDQACATELRRARKRGTLPTPPQRVVINERVCEGCGDCGAKSNCLSVEPVETEFGRKTRIHQASCNTDLSCLQGDCPSFTTVVSPAEQRRAPLAPPSDLPAPVGCVPADDVRIRLVGIGGTGVVTVAQVLGTAAVLDGRSSTGLDQTGLSQKAGTVVSDLRITADTASGGVVPAAGGVDVLLGLDLLGTATRTHLQTATPERTVAVISTSVVPTAAMVIDVAATTPDVGAARAAIDRVTRADENVFVDARALAEAVFGDHLPANVILLGAAWQRGAIPVSLEALREAFRLNGAAVDANLAALEWGRACVAAPERVADVLAGRTAAPSAPLPATAVALVDRIAPEPGELRRLLEIRVGDLVGWGGARVARRYAEAVEQLARVEHERDPGSTAVTEAFAVGLHKLTAYKDEYEVARLHVAGLADLPRGSKVTFHLHPPVLRALGMQRKLRLGGWFVPVFRTMQRFRWLRGTALDPFGHAEVRRVERRLPDEYRALVRSAVQRLDAGNRDQVVALAETPDIVRGYEQIKLDNVARFRDRTGELLAAIEHPDPQSEAVLAVIHHEGQST